MKSLPNFPPILLEFDLDFEITKCCKFSLHPNQTKPLKFYYLLILSLSPQSSSCSLELGCFRMQHFFFTPFAPLFPEFNSHTHLLPHPLASTMLPFSVRQPPHSFDLSFSSLLLGHPLFFRCPPQLSSRDRERISTAATVLTFGHPDFC